MGSLIAGFDGWRANLHRMAVHPQWRRRGLGLALVAEAERRLEAQGAKRAGATVIRRRRRSQRLLGGGRLHAQPGTRRHVKSLEAAPLPHE